jgi:predicted DNA-binding transcriptional regulator AlpA
MRLLDWKALKARGHVFTRRHTERLVKEGKFPAPIRVGENRIAWIEEEVDAHNAASQPNGSQEPPPSITPSHNANRPGRRHPERPKNAKTAPRQVS